MKDGELICTRPKNALEDCIVVDGKHPAIIDIELYNLAISKQNNNPRVKSYVSVRNHFAGILYCECGRAMVLKPYYKKGTSGTKERASSRILCPNQHHCNNGSALYSLLQHEIVNILTGYLADIKITLTDENPNEDIINDTKIKQLQSRIEHLEAKELSLWDKYSEECMPQSVFQKLITKNEAALTAARKELNNTLAQSTKSFPVRERIDTIQTALDSLQDETIPAEYKNTLLKTCIKRITYSRKKCARNSNHTNTHTLKGWLENPIELDIELNF